MDTHLRPRFLLRIAISCGITFCVFACLPAFGAGIASCGPSAEHAAIVVQIPGLIGRASHLFDLEGTTLRFTPDRKGGYRAQNVQGADLAPTPHTLSTAEMVAAQGRVTLPLAFPFGGAKWTELFVNLSGSVSFGRSERAVEGERGAWASGGMRSVAAALDERAAAGQERMIAVLWAANNADAGRWRISTGGDADRFVVTWEVERVPWGHAVEGRSRFQARLYRDGGIEMVYAAVSRRDGIVGLFCGGGGLVLLDHVECAASAPTGGVKAVDVFDAGTTLEFVFTLRHEFPRSLASGHETFHAAIENGTAAWQGWLTVGAGVSCYADVDADPRTFGYRIEGSTATLFVSKMRLLEPERWKWSASVESDQNGKSESAEIIPYRSQRPIRAARRSSGESRLATARGSRVGNLYEAFHYPWVPKESRTLLRALYARRPAEDDFAVIFTDFRIDDLFAQGPSTGALSVPIQGIGEAEASPQSTAELGFRSLQVTPATVWIGAPFFSECGPDEFGMGYSHFARGVAWLAHEITHRWGEELRFRNAITGKEEPLHTPTSHWLPDLYAQSVVSGAAGDTFGMARSFSVMAESRGTEWRENPDGLFQFRRTPWWRNPGYSALDLYVMGLIPPEEVPDTFLIADLKPAAPGPPDKDGWCPPVMGMKVPVRIQDIVAAMGPRIPDAAHAQKEFRLGIYLAHAPGRPVDPAMRDRADRVARALARFFVEATGHRMRIVLSH